MSVISDRHQINPFVSGKSAALANQRLLKVGYKSSKERKTGKVIPAKFPSVCASVPVFDNPTLVANIEVLADMLRDTLETTQNAIVKSLYESSGGTLSTVADEEISISACVAYIESVGRLTIEASNQWFDAQVAESMIVAIADKLGFDLSTPEQEETVGKHVASYKQLFAVLAPGKTELTEDQKRNLRRALEISGADDEIAKKFAKRLEAKKAEKPQVQVLEL